jgi:tetratricopeptide (TPR) repeat protein
VATTAVLEALSPTEVDRACHAGGLITGLILAWILARRLEDMASRRLLVAGRAAHILLWVGVLGVLVPTALKHEGIWGLQDRAWRAANRGRDDVAIRYYSEVLARDPDNVLALAGRAASRINQDDYEGALRDYGSCLQAAPENSEALIGRAGVFREMGDWSRSIADLERVLARDPVNAWAMAGRALTRQFAGDPASALRDADRAYSLTEIDFGEVMLRAPFNDVQELGDRFQAHSNAAYIRGLVRTALGDFDGAIADFSEVMNSDAYADYARPARAEAVRLKGNLDLALAEFEQMLKKYPEDPDSLLGRARIRAARGDLDAARADFEAALKSANRWWRHRATAEAALRDLKQPPKRSGSP